MNNKKITCLIALVTIIYGTCFNTEVVKAEGSKEMVKNGGYRPYTEWTSSDTSAGIVRKTLLKVYVKSGEKINLGSSVVPADPNKEIVVRSPSGNQL